MIRIATIEDFPIIKEYVSALMKESVYADLFKDYVFTEEMAKLYLNPDTRHEKICFIFSTDEGEDVGMGVFDIVPWLYLDKVMKIARISYPYIKPAFRSKGFGKELKITFEHWGKAVGAQYYSVSHPGEGYKEYETIYMKEVL